MFCCVWCLEDDQRTDLCSCRDDTESENRTGTRGDAVSYDRLSLSISLLRSRTPSELLPFTISLSSVARRVSCRVLQ